MALDAAELTEILEGSRPQIIAGIRDKVVETLISHSSYKLAELINKQVAEFYETEVAPAIAAELRAGKQIMIDAATKGAAEIGANLAQKMVEKAGANLAGYRGSDIFKALFA